MTGKIWRQMWSIIVEANGRRSDGVVDGVAFAGRRLGVRE